MSNAQDPAQFMKNSIKLGLLTQLTQNAAQNPAYNTEIFIVPIQHQNIIDYVFNIDFDNLLKNVDLWYESSISIELGALSQSDQVCSTKIVFPHWYFTCMTIPDMRNELIKQITKTVEFHKFQNPYLIRMIISFEM
jgi:hypothetical protein